MTQEFGIIILIGIIAALIKIYNFPERFIQSLRLRPLAITILVAAAITPTPDMLTCFLLSSILFAIYLVCDLAILRIRKTAKQQ